MGERISFLCPDDLLAEIKARGPISDAIRIALRRYFQLLRQQRLDLRGRLAPEEFPSILEECLPKNAEDMAGFIEDALARRITQLTPLEVIALADALERYRRAAATGLPVDAGHILA